MYFKTVLNIRTEYRPLRTHTMILPLRVHVSMKARKRNLISKSICINPGRYRDSKLFALVLKKKEQLVKDVLDARRKTAERFQKNKSLQSLSSNKVINVSNSKEFPKKQSQEHQIELQMQTERSKCNEQTLSEDNEVTEKNNDKFQQSEKFPQSSNIEKNSNFEDPVDSISSTDDSVANDTAIKEHVDIPSKAASNFKHKRDKSSSSTTSEKENEMQDLNSRLSKIDKKLEELNCKINTVSDRKLEELSCKINTIITN